MPQLKPSNVRRSVRIRGVVQAVGFRPAIYRLATSLELGGFVRNETGSVWIEVEGPSERVGDFLSMIPDSIPSPARIDTLETELLFPIDQIGFSIEPTAPERGATVPLHACIPADLAPCAPCLLELSDPNDRRYRYPFINCAGCGPRYTLIRSLPYDRVSTTMDPFPLCAACSHEYQNPADRRFHAETNSCPACGPSLSYVSGADSSCGQAALAAGVAALHAGSILAVKGAGGFALSCDARNGQSISLLRSRKDRPHKPFAVMGRNFEVLDGISLLDDRSRQALLSPARPIVLVPLRQGASISHLVAPGLGEIGVFLPPTPLQHLLLLDGPPLQVVTSGNRGGEPISCSNEEALSNLSGIADAWLLHDRGIHTRADDSVVRMVNHTAVSIRRARGYVPDPIHLPICGPAVLAVGAGEKNTICLTAGGSAFLSQHLGDIGEPATYRLFQESIEHLSRIYGIEPSAVAHDLHPDFRSTRWALASGLPCLSVQHHHAHIAACLAEHQRTEPVLGIAFDGAGLGPDGSTWGGEVLLADLSHFERVAHLRPIALAGGDMAVRQPWRLALAALLDAGEPIACLDRIDPDAIRSISRLFASGYPLPSSTGAGRWFDAVSALCGLRHAISWEGQAAVELESAAMNSGSRTPFPFELRESDIVQAAGVAGAQEGGEPLPQASNRYRRPFEIDLRPTIREIARGLRAGMSVSTVAARFHSTLARAILDSCLYAKSRSKEIPSVVALAGGCFQNRRLTEETSELLTTHGFEVLTNQRVPANDGGISLGQAIVASSRLAASNPGS